MIIKKIFVFLFFFIIFENVANARNKTNIIVKIEDELITTYDFKSKIVSTLILTKKEINQQNINDLKKPALESLIQNRLKKIELKKYDIKRDNSQINSYLNSISSNNIENLKTLFTNSGVDFKAFINEIDTEFKWNRLIYKIYSSKIEINSDDIDREIKEKISNQSSLVKYKLSEIEILSINKNLDNEKISQVLNEINNVSFEEAVIKFSISSTASNKGSLGWVNSNSLSNDFVDILEKIKIGEVTRPIKRLDKIIFLKLNDKTVSNYSESNINNLKEELINQKKNELFKLYSSSFLSKLRNTKFIEYYK